MWDMIADVFESLIRAAIESHGRHCAHVHLVQEHGSDACACDDCGAILVGDA